MTGLEGQLLEFIRGLYGRFGYGGIVIAMAIESACVPLPSEIIMPLAGFMIVARSAGFNLLGVSVAGAIGSVIGSLVAYWIGAAGGRPVLLKYGRYVLISAHDADVADRFFARYGDLAIFVTRLMPIVRTFISLPAGMARMRLPAFILYTFAGSLLWSLLLAYAGQLLGSNWQEVGSVLRAYDGVVGVIVVLLIALFFYRHVRG
jgi:membrane protein DedA with SNARE-associated domain